jgi:putative transposase
VAWKNRKAFVADLKQVYQASTREDAESHLLQLGESWENNWEDLAAFFAYQRRSAG